MPGFTGVDVFFVVTGFVITAVVLRDLQAGVLSTRQFFLRRIRCLIAALVLMFATSAIVFTMSTHPACVLTYARSLLAQTVCCLPTAVSGC